MKKKFDKKRKQKQRGENCKMSPTLRMVVKKKVCSTFYILFLKYIHVHV